MRIVVAHNYYRSELPSGENQTVAELMSGLREAGIETRQLARYSDSIQTMNIIERLRLPTLPIRSASAIREFRQMAKTDRPDILQVHNVFPLISPALLQEANRIGVPVVQFLHNYRLLCLPGTLMRDGSRCTKCIDGSKLNAVRYHCYRESRTQSAIMTVALGAYGGYASMVDNFVAISAHMKRALVSSGVDAAKITVIANSVPDPGVPTRSPEQVFLFASRLDEHKGVRLVLEAWRRADLGSHWSLEIGGTGPLAPLVQEHAGEDHRIRYLGPLNRDEMTAAYRRSAVVLTTPLWDEPFGRTTAEAFSFGRPVIATNGGALNELVDPEVGWCVEATADAVADALSGAAGDAPGLITCGAAARRRYLDRYTPARQLEGILALHHGAQVRSRSGEGS